MDQGHQQVSGRSTSWLFCSLVMTTLSSLQLCTSNGSNEMEAREAVESNGGNVIKSTSLITVSFSSLPFQTRPALSS